MNRIYLIDYENVNESGLNGLFDIGCSDIAYIFYTEKNNKISFDFLQRFGVENKGCQIKFMKSASGKNALDFQLSSFLGSLIEKNGIEECEYVIVSKDNGFCCLSSFWANERPGTTIIYAPSITRITGGSNDKEPPVPEEAGKAPECESEPGANGGDIKKDAEAAAAVQQQQPAAANIKQLSSQERVALNNAVQQAMSAAKYDAKTINDIASVANKAYKEGKGKKEIYASLIRKYKRDKGLEIYNVIKPALK